MPVFAGQGDPAWSLAALWGAAEPPPARPGPRPSLSLDAIVAAAIEIADRGGLAALSMKAVGQRLGCTAMALYTYVPGKAELLDLCYDRVYAELPTSYPTGRGWRAAARAWARDLGEFYLRHPWTLQISYARPVLGPNEQAVVETLTGILRHTGLGPAAVRRAVSALLHLVRGAAQTRIDARAAPTATGTPSAAWWQARAPQLQKVAPDFASRFPHTVWLGQGAAAGDRGDPEDYLVRQADDAYAAGVELLLDGIEAQRAAQGTGRP
ncbi:MAG TPA: TetR/AcrR family transcriptional regulator C-terminal domain-containing protein [Natronosporangium sp.]